MQLMLDYLGSIITFGVFFLTALSLQGNITDLINNNSSESNLQQDIVSIAKLIDYDFSKMGYNASIPHIKTGADSVSLTLYGDIDNNADVDSVYYYRSAQDTLTENPDDFFIYRQVNSATPGIVMGGVTRFRLSYFTGTDSLIPAADLTTLVGVSKVRKVAVQIELQSATAVGDEYNTVFWERRFRPFALND